MRHRNTPLGDRPEPLLSEGRSLRRRHGSTRQRLAALPVAYSASGSRLRVSPLQQCGHWHVSVIVNLRLPPSHVPLSPTSVLLSCRLDGFILVSIIFLIFYGERERERERAAAAAAAAAASSSRKWWWWGQPREKQRQTERESSRSDSLSELLVLSPSLARSLTGPIACMFHSLTLNHIFTHANPCSLASVRGGSDSESRWREGGGGRGCP